MTQNTQTTAVWIESILETELHLIPLMVGVDADSADIGGMDAAARIIAVRIDRLTADNAQANQWLVNGVAKIERLEKERDEARAEARAEVERLRPAAEAWRTLEAARKEERTGTDENEHAEYWVHILARNAARAADRARAAKESQP